MNLNTVTLKAEKLEQDGHATAEVASRNKEQSERTFVDILKRPCQPAYAAQSNLTMGSSTTSAEVSRQDCQSFNTTDKMTNDLDTAKERLFSPNQPLNQLEGKEAEAENLSEKTKSIFETEDEETHSVCFSEFKIKLPNDFDKPTTVDAPEKRDDPLMVSLRSFKSVEEEAEESLSESKALEYSSDVFVANAKKQNTSITVEFSKTADFEKVRQALRTMLDQNETLEAFKDGKVNEFKVHLNIEGQPLKLNMKFQEGELALLFSSESQELIKKVQSEEGFLHDMLSQQNFCQKDQTIDFSYEEERPAAKNFEKQAGVDSDGGAATLGKNALTIPGEVLSDAYYIHYL